MIGISVLISGLVQLVLVLVGSLLAVVIATALWVAWSGWRGSDYVEPL